MQFIDPPNMVYGVNHDMENVHHRLLKIQCPHDSKWREKKGLEDEENSIKQVDGSTSDSYIHSFT